MAIKIKMLLVSVATCALFTTGLTNAVKADEHLTDQQIEQATKGLQDDSYILTTRFGGILYNQDGSGNFSADEIGESGKVMKVAEYKQLLKNVDISELQPQSSVTPGVYLFAGYAPAAFQTLRANETYRSQPFYFKGWRYGEARFIPELGTGDYLLWQAEGDSGIAEDGQGASATINPGAPQYVYSRRGTYFKTYNPLPGSVYIVSNPI